MRKSHYAFHRPTKTYLFGERFRKSRDSSPSWRYLVDKESKKKDERDDSRKKKIGIEGEPEHGHFVCLVPRGDTRCMGAAMRIIANVGTPLSGRRGEQGVSSR